MSTVEGPIDDVAIIGVNMRIQRFDSVKEFAASATGIVYFHVFRGTPDNAMCDAVLRAFGRSESLIGIDADESAGFLCHLETASQTPFVGAFSNGAFIDYADTVEGVPAMMANARRWYVPDDRNDNRDA